MWVKYTEKSQTQCLSYSVWFHLCNNFEIEKSPKWEIDKWLLKVNEEVGRGWLKRTTWRIFVVGWKYLDYVSMSSEAVLVF